ncbi:MAG: phosphodiester glycosidase family protein [Deltaproteobacteria bacterium]|jgi:hypothetical protein|nr:phosphodiester glycosidase family protein [Deltaproteobacteria bacterium]
MSGLRLIIMGCAFALLSPAPVAAGATPEILWRALEPGLSLASVPVTVAHALPEESPPGPAKLPSPAPVSVTTTVLRIDPAHFAFSLYMASERGPKTLAEIGKSENFAAAVNAGMYLPDGRTSTGYLHGTTHTNNARVAANFGAFFVAEPLVKGLAPALLLDRQKDDWRAALGRYGVVIQNYRMTTPEGRILWKQEAAPHSVAALSQDPKGNILFLFCREPVFAGDFVAALLRLPLGIRSVMYLEGGTDAALLIRAGGIDSVQAGRHSSGLWSGDGNLALPNVLGIRRRTGDTGR